MNQHYFDFDTMSTTKVAQDVLNTYQDLLNKYYANSDSLHVLGREVATLLNASRQQVANLLGVLSKEIIFTSGASEANNLAIKGFAFANQAKGKHLITTSIEHASVLKAFSQLENEFGFEITYLPVNKFGEISLDDLKKSIKESTILVSIMSINNELGTIFPINEIKSYLKKFHPQVIFHTDLVQAVGKYPIDLNDIDMACLSAHKINGLKGSGILVKKERVRLLPLISGGLQEYGLRGGTSNALTHIMWAKTLRLALENQEKSLKTTSILNKELREKLSSISNIVINSSKNSSSYILNVSLNVLNSEIIQNALSKKNILISAASTCSGKSYQDSHVLKAIGLSEKARQSTFRIGLSAHLNSEAIDYLVTSLKEIIDLYGKV